MHQGALVAFGLLPTSSRAFSVLEALHRRSEFEFGPDVVFEQENDFTHYRFENGASRILILSCKIRLRKFDARDGRSKNETIECDILGE